MVVSSVTQMIGNLLDLAVRSMEPSSAADGAPAFRGLYIGREEVGRLLARRAGATPFDAMFAEKAADGDPVHAEESPLFRLM